MGDTPYSRHILAVDNNWATPLSRVGIFGTSAGAQSAAGAFLFHPEFYQAAVANSGCHDNRMDKASWNEQWMGFPVGPQYAECSNIENAAKLRGHLISAHIGPLHSSQSTGHAHASEKPRR